MQRKGTCLQYVINISTFMVPMLCAMTHWVSTAKLELRRKMRLALGCQHFYCVKTVAWVSGFY